MTALILAVFIASLSGSLHCAGMCGAFVAFAVTGADPSKKSGVAAPLAAYHVGRLLTYATLGAIAGALGAAIDLGGAAVGLQRAAAVFAGVMMVGFGVIVLLRHRGVKLPRAPLPPGMTRLVTRAHAFAARQAPVARGLLIGLSTTLLPCGWLYAFVITAAGTASAPLGALTMTVFWLGTLPILTGIGLGARRLLGPLNRHAPVMIAAGLVIVGLFTISHRIAAPPMRAAFAETTPAAQTEVDRVRSLDSSKMPCCDLSASAKTASK
ncbi:MAG: sulfite exporter TauE/SafE family protein [Planctomycetota bacterium]|nr:sulfite exporter TauE/SafE family protein [Planctomycetota bacterium]